MHLVKRITSIESIVDAQMVRVSIFPIQPCDMHFWDFRKGENISDGILNTYDEFHIGQVYRHFSLYDDFMPNQMTYIKSRSITSYTCTQLFALCLFNRIICLNVSSSSLSLHLSLYQWRFSQNSQRSHLTRFSPQFIWIVHNIQQSYIHPRPLQLAMRGSRIVCSHFSPEMSFPCIPIK